MPEVGWTERVAKEWRRYKTPSRPSRSEIIIYEKFFKQLPMGSKVLILGSTPEIRDLAAKCRMNVTICDWSEDICKALKLLMKRSNAPENFHKQDWREMNLDQSFDMIIGDCATTVVPYTDLDTVLRNIEKSLKPDGIAVQRIWVRHKDQKYSLKGIENRFVKKPWKIHWYTWMLFPVFLHYYNTEKESLSGEEMHENLKKDCNNGTVPEELVKMFSLVKNHKTSNNVLLKADLENLLKKYFIIDEVLHGKDNFRRNAPIYILRGK